MTSDNSIQGSKDDIEKHRGLDYGSFGLPLSVEKANDQVNNFLKTINTILCFNFEFVCENHNLKVYNTFIFILLTISNSYCFVWGCTWRFFASQNNYGLCPFNFGSSPQISPLVQNAKITSCWGELIACDFDLHGVLVAKKVVGFHMWMFINSSITFKLGLKDFLMRRLIRFEIYIWFTTWHYNIDKYH